MSWKIDKNIYKKLAKIRKPVMIWVEDAERGNWKQEPSRYSRLRILYPNGKCVFRTIDAIDMGFNDPIASCFVAMIWNLETTVRRMKRFDTKDDGYLKITAVEYL